MFVQITDDSQFEKLRKDMKIFYVAKRECAVKVSMLQDFLFFTMNAGRDKIGLSLYSSQLVQARLTFKSKTCTSPTDLIL
jgi:hypothetical protein